RHPPPLLSRCSSDLRPLGDSYGLQTDVAIHHGSYPSGSVGPLVAAPFMAATSQSGARVGRPSLLMQACTVCPRINTSVDPRRYTLYSNRTFTRVWLTRRWISSTSSYRAGFKYRTPTSSTGR